MEDKKEKIKETPETEEQTVPPVEEVKEKTVPEESAPEEEAPTEEEQPQSIGGIELMPVIEKAPKEEKKKDENKTSAKIINLDKTKIKKIIKVLVIILVVALVVGLGIFFTIKIINNVTKESKKVNALVEVNSKKLKFGYGDDKFSIGDKYADFKKAGFIFDERFISNDDVISYDMVYVQNVYKDGDPKFLGLFYCPEKEGCKYEDTVLIKATFFKDRSLEIAGQKVYSLYYDGFKKAFGKEKGHVKDREKSLVWNFGDKDNEIGQAYFIARFGDYSGLEEISIGVWWYEGEYKHTVEK